LDLSAFPRKPLTLPLHKPHAFTNTVSQQAPKMPGITSHFCSFTCNISLVLMTSYLPSKPYWFS
jgi:hypothetical protein